MINAADRKDIDLESLIKKSRGLDIVKGQIIFRLIDVVYPFDLANRLMPKMLEAIDEKGRVIDIRLELTGRRRLVSDSIDKPKMLMLDPRSLRHWYLRPEDFFEDFNYRPRA